MNDMFKSITITLYYIATKVQSTTVQLQYNYSTTTVQLQFNYSSTTVQLQFNYSSTTVQSTTENTDVPESGDWRLSGGILVS